MKQSEALNKAHKMWGPGAMVCFDERKPRALCYAVGTCDGFVFSIRGRGPSWAAAFRDYDNKVQAAKDGEGKSCPRCGDTMHNPMIDRPKRGRRWFAVCGKCANPFLLLGVRI